MNLKPLLIGAGVFIGVRAFARANNASKLKFDIGGVPLVNVQGNTAIFSVPVTAVNSTGETFNVRQVFTRVWFNNTFLGTATSTAAFTIPAYSRTNIPVQVAVVISNAVSAILQAITHNQPGRTIRIEGTIVTNTVTIPLSVTKTV